MSARQSLTMGLRTGGHGRGPVFVASLCCSNCLVRGQLRTSSTKLVRGSWTETQVPPRRNGYASHLDAARSGNLAKFIAMRRASSRVSRRSMAGLCCSSSKQKYPNACPSASRTMKHSSSSSIDQGGGKRRSVISVGIRHLPSKSPSATQAKPPRCRRRRS